MSNESTKAIDHNSAALRQVAVEIFWLLELVVSGTILRLPHCLHVAANRLLVPAESALRRLIIVAAYGLSVALPRAWLRVPPKGRPVAAKTTSSLCFKLYDTRKRFNRSKRKIYTKLDPQIRFIGLDHGTSHQPLNQKKQKTSARICRRFAAFKLALNDIPAQAKRLALWQARRIRNEKGKFRLPLRPGPPPGFHRKITMKIDAVLEECHHLARLVEREAPS